MEKVIIGAFVSLAAFAAAAYSSVTVSRLPLTFEANAGQAPAEVRFLSRNSDFTLLLTSSGVVLEPHKGQPQIVLKFSGDRSRPVVSGLEPLSAKANYFLGNDRSAWRTDIPMYAKVQYKNLYRGIDLVFHGADRELEYDFLISPGADPGAIALKFEGANALRVDPSGDLILETASGQLRQRLPRVYQDWDGKRIEIPAAYRVSGRSPDATVRIAVHGYDTTRPLVVDPVLSYATYLGGSGTDQAARIAVDAAGNAYVIGDTTSPNFPTANPLQAARRGPQNVFVAKLNPAGALVYSTYLGGSAYEQGLGIAVDSSGNVYVTGSTNSGDFPTVAPFQRTIGGQSDAFVTKLNAGGDALVYSTYLGGSRVDQAYAITVDASGHAYVAGSTLSADFPTVKPFQSTFRDGGWLGTDAFVTKFGADGSVIYSTFLGGRDSELASGIAADGDGYAYVVGQTRSTDFPVVNALQSACGCPIVSVPLLGDMPALDGLVTKIAPDGSALVYSTFLGGKGDDSVDAIAVDLAGNVYVAGSTNSGDFPTRNPIQAQRNGTLSDAFVAKLNPAGSTLIFSTYLGGSAFDDVLGIAVDTSGTVSVAGQTESPNFPTVNAFQPAFGGLRDAFVARLNSSGSALVYSSYLGGSGRESGYIAVDAAGNAYVAGVTESSDFPAVNAVQPASGGGTEAFVAKITDSGTYISAVNTAYGSQDIAPNTWIEIKGNGLALDDLGPNGFTWSSAPEFNSGRMPTELRGVSVRVSGKPAYVYYISPTQVNVLTPLDDTTGSVKVEVTNGANTSPPFTVPRKSHAPSFFLLGATRYVAATHVNGSLLGPVSMSAPGYPFTPAQPNETIVLYANGFGLPTSPLVEGSASQSGVLPVQPVVQIGGATATVTFAGLISPGLWQFNVVVPAGAANGDNAVSIAYAGLSTPDGAVITVQR